MQVYAPFHLSQLVLPSMRERKQGWIVNISSGAGLHPKAPYTRRGGGTVYGMCKAALERFTTGLASEVYDDGIAVNVVSPGLVDTPGVAVHGLINDATRDRVQPIKFIAEAVYRLASGDPKTLTGTINYAEPFLKRTEGRACRACLRGEPMIEQTVGYHDQRRSMTTFIAHPERSAAYPVVLFFMDAPAIREELRGHGPRIAAVGYYVMLPNLYYRAGVMELAELPPLPEKEARARMFQPADGPLTIPLVMSDGDALLDFAPTATRQPATARWRHSATA